MVLERRLRPPHSTIERRAGCVPLVVGVWGAVARSDLHEAKGSVGERTLFGVARPGLAPPPNHLQEVGRVRFPSGGRPAAERIIFSLVPQYGPDSHALQHKRCRARNF